MSNKVKTYSKRKSTGTNAGDAKEFPRYRQSQSTSDALFGAVEGSKKSHIVSVPVIPITANALDVNVKPIPPVKRPKPRPKPKLVPKAKKMPPLKKRKKDFDEYLDQMTADSLEAVVDSGEDEVEQIYMDLIRSTPKKKPRKPVKKKVEDKKKQEGIVKPPLTPRKQSPKKISPMKPRNSPKKPSNRARRSLVETIDLMIESDNRENSHRSVTSSLQSSSLSSPLKSGVVPASQAESYSSDEAMEFVAPVTVTSRDDVNLSGMNVTSRIEDRIICGLKLMSICSDPEKHMLLRAHDAVKRISQAIVESNPSCSSQLALISTAILTILSHEPSNYECFEETVMLECIATIIRKEMEGWEESKEKESSTKNRLLKRAVMKKDKGNSMSVVAKVLPITNKLLKEEFEHVSAGYLALSVVARLERTNLSYKDRIRQILIGCGDSLLGVVNSFMMTISESLTSEVTSFQMKTYQLSARTLEWACLMNPQNQSILTDNNLLLHKLIDNLTVLSANIPFDANQSKGELQLESLLSTVRLLVNLTNGCESAVEKIADEKIRVETICGLFSVILPESDRYDGILLLTGLLTNLVEENVTNRETLMNMTSLKPTVCGLPIPIQTDISLPELLSWLFIEKNRSLMKCLMKEGENSTSAEDHILAGHLSVLICSLVKHKDAKLLKLLADSMQRFADDSSHFGENRGRTLIDPALRSVVDALERFVEFQIKSGLVLDNAEASLRDLLQVVGGVFT